MPFDYSSLLSTSSQFWEQGFLSPKTVDQQDSIRNTSWSEYPVTLEFGLLINLAHVNISTASLVIQISKTQLSELSEYVPTIVIFWLRCSSVFLLMKIFLFTLIESGIFPKFPSSGKALGSMMGAFLFTISVGWSALLCCRKNWDYKLTRYGCSVWEGNR